MRINTWTRRTAALALGAAAAVALTAGSASAASSLSSGSYGSAVGCLQQALDYVDSAGLKVDNDFGSLTYNAVVHYQHGHSLSPDGVVGPATGGALKNDVRNAYYAANRAGDPSGIYGSWLTNCSGQLPG
ncbi:peptidoglycan-binding protein [Kitasatospora sp. SUK 42]|uniref:peptidoglycan-binding domain-containing protein n=1 Tax=Kitasatospora sp. SUK 42 TaxID=1588882 RepID=UPI0018C9D89D|nr:peptidoglycan-binding domain-containing protein [Kitasatospora sp. SUK 42]MBV2151546.1 peptidoglycan-binding protein [Kitasatospora sp. SUK 42]